MSYQKRSGCRRRWLWQTSLRLGKVRKPRACCWRYIHVYIYIYTHHYIHLSFWNSCGLTTVKPCGTAYFGWKTLGFLFVGVPVCSYSLVDVEVEIHAASCCTLKKFPLQVFGWNSLRFGGTQFFLENRKCVCCSVRRIFTTKPLAIKKRIVNKVSSLLKNKEVQLFGGPNFLFVHFLFFLLINFHPWFLIVFFLTWWLPSSLVWTLYLNRASSLN